MKRADENGSYFSGDGFEDKNIFIKNLGWLLSQTREGIKECVLIHKGPYDEYVMIKFNDGAVKYVNISADSYLAIIRDVTKNI